MEKDCKMKKQSNEGPLQDLNGRRVPIQIIHKPTTKKPSIPSSYSSPAAVSDLKFHISSKTLSFSKKTSNEPRKCSRPKENNIPRKPLSQKSKSICKNGQRSKLPSVPAITLKKRSTARNNSKVNGSKTSGERLLDTSNLNCAERCSPVRKLLNSGFSLDSMSVGTSIDDDFSLYLENNKNDNSSTATSVKTPPIEPSSSPDIQSHIHHKIPVLNKPAATPVCYGTGHLLSGVADNRKCRRRGSLKGGFEKVYLFSDSHDSPIPLPAEASVRWLLSPRDDEECDNALSSGNVLTETPNSESIDSITELLTRVDLTRFQENVDNVSCTLDDMWLSQIRVSWRDKDEFDFCNVLSDEEATDGSANGLSVDGDVFPTVLDYEPCISVRGKEKTSSDRANACAESICTDGGGLVASNDSDLNFTL